ncbi:site-specific recombinase XerD [Salinisphaera shabanensis T35B1]|uniref:tyrosine-type recombinase/integrase n=1 Tax=Salinisphaera shabanensis TaxID=180542 RepID=UPI003341C21F
MGTTEASAWEGINADLLPDGFPFLADFEQGPGSKPGVIIGPVFQFLVDIFIDGFRTSDKKRRRVPYAARSPDAAITMAHLLAEWWQWLHVDDLAWNQIEADDIVRYRNDLSSIVSPKTCERLSSGTIRNRISSVLGFYDWAHKRRLIEAAIVSHEVFVPPQPIDRDPLAHMRSWETPPTRSNLPRNEDILPRNDTGPQVRPLNLSALKRVLSVLGPMPSEASKTALCRDRLAATLSFTTGLRVDEVVWLTIWQIERLQPNDDNPKMRLPLKVIKTKGACPRVVEIPCWLVAELQQYILTERAEATRLGRSRGYLEPRESVDALFVNGPKAGAHIGRRCGRHTFQSAFRKAVLACELTVEVAKEDPENQREPWIAIEAAHRYHDLRHTFAITRYQEERRKGNQAPWETIQRLLGHRYVTTTLDTYLAHTTGYVTDIIDSVDSAIDSIGRNG